MKFALINIFLLFATIATAQDSGVMPVKIISITRPDELTIKSIRSAIPDEYSQAAELRKEVPMLYEARIRAGESKHEALESIFQIIVKEVITNQ
jgi:hypothetical protein